MKLLNRFSCVEIGHNNWTGFKAHREKIDCGHVSRHINVYCNGHEYRNTELFIDQDKKRPIY